MSNLGVIFVPCLVVKSFKVKHLTFVQVQIRFPPNFSFLLILFYHFSPKLVFIMKSNFFKSKLALLLLASTLAQTDSQAAPLIHFGKQNANKAKHQKIKGVQYFQGSWKETQIAARQQKHIVFVEIYAENYAPSRLLNDLLMEKSVAEYYNQHFINYRVDINSVIGNEFIKNYKVAAAGELLFFAPNGKIISHQAGATSAAQLNAIARSVIKQTMIDLNTMQEQYNKGFRSTDFLYDFAYQLRENNRPNDEVVANYIKKEKLANHCTDTKDLRFVYDFSTDLRTDAMDVLLKNKSTFERTFGKENIDKKITTAATTAAENAKTTKDAELLNKACEVVEKSKISNAKDLLFKMKWDYFETTKDNKSQVKLITEYMNGYAGYDSEVYYQKAIQLMYAAKSNIQDWKTAQKWFEKSITLDAGYQNQKDYARLLIKLGDSTKAKQMLTQALNAGRSKGIDCSEGQLLLETLSKYSSSRIVSL